jgi:bidirectional [NiFe] hydrogenase diaphorase subunit
LFEAGHARSGKMRGEMPTTAKAPVAHPSGDKRFKILDAAMRRHQHQANALLEILHQAQELFGFLADDVMLYVARGLRLPPSRVYGVATFYNLFALKPKGAHTCTVCMGTACYVKGAGEILGSVEKAYGVKSGGTTRDGHLSVMTARCVGACGIAPAVVFDAETVGKQSAATVLERVKGWAAP